ncbi:hypothetical protein HMPREF1503_0989 [Olsenella uli MSTE5]|nr:hypothetical protein HMPREF1503_0989 [Olsenella uli MSTE5]
MLPLRCHVAFVSQCNHTPGCRTCLNMQQRKLASDGSCGDASRDRWDDGWDG